jgi:hypothetical protein
MNVADPNRRHPRTKGGQLRVDKLALREIRGRTITGDVTRHIVVNSLENNLLLNYDPYATLGGAPQQSGSLNPVAV